MSLKEKEPRNKQLTVYINDYIHEVIKKLKGHCGDHLSSVGYYIIKDWIIKNSKIIVDQYNINLAEIQSRYYPDSGDITVEREYTKSKKKIIDSLPQKFKGIESISVEDLADQLDTKPKVIIELFTFHYEEIEKTKLRLILSDKVILNKSLEL